MVDPVGSVDQVGSVDPVATPGHAPFVVVVNRTLVEPSRMVPLLRLEGSTRPGRVDRNHAPGDLATYQPIPELDVPDAPAYVLVGIERGEEFCGRTPKGRCCR